MSFEIDFNNKQAHGILIYVQEDFSFDTLQREDGWSSALVNEISLEVLDEKGFIMCVWGSCPYVSWQDGQVTPPLARAGALFFKSLPIPGVSKGVTNERWNVIYDRRTGWLLVAPGVVPVGVEVVEFLPNCVAAVRHGELVGLWLKPIFYDSNPTAA